MSWEQRPVSCRPSGALYPHAVDDTEIWSQFLGSEIEATAYVTARALERFGNQADDVEILARPVTSVRPMADGRRIRFVVMASLRGEFPAIMAMVDGSPLHALGR